MTEGVSGWETTAVTETEVSENPVTGDVEVEEVKVVETSVPETTASTTNGWGDVEPVAAPAVAAPAKPASRTIQPGTKMSWAQIARCVAEYQTRESKLTDPVLAALLNPNLHLFPHPHRRQRH